MPKAAGCVRTQRYAEPSHGRGPRLGFEGVRMPGSVVSPEHPRAAAVASSSGRYRRGPCSFEDIGSERRPHYEDDVVAVLCAATARRGRIHGAAGDDPRAALTAPPIRTSSKQRCDYSSATPAFASRKAGLIKSILSSRLGSPFAPSKQLTTRLGPILHWGDPLLRDVQIVRRARHLRAADLNRRRHYPSRHGPPPYRA